MPKFLRSQPGGVGQYYDGYLEDGKLVREVYESTCNHCSRITEVPTLRAAREGHVVGFCRGCMRPICLQCVGKPCVTQEQEAERVENAVRKQILVGEWR